MNKKVALIELSEGHFECLYSQARFLYESGYDVHLISQTLYKTRTKYFDTVNACKFIDIKSGFFNNIKAGLEIRKYLKKEGISKVVFNTAHGTLVRNIVFVLKNFEVFGVVHEINKLNNSFTQKIITKRVKSYFTLNDYLGKSGEAIHRGKQIKSFYPIFFPEYKDNKTIVKEDEAFWVCIPGQLEYKRRNYLSLIESLSRDLNENIKFVLLGRSRHSHGDGEHFETAAREKGVLNKFVIFDDFVEDSDFHNYLKKSDIVMPLLIGRDRYQEKAISGSFNLAFGYGIPMLIEDNFSSIDDFIASSIFYSIDDIVNVLNRLYEDRSPLVNIQHQMKQYEKFSFDFQMKHYISVIEGASE